MSRINISPRADLTDWRDGRDAEWQAVHIFYTANARPLIGECLSPLVASLREDGLIRGYFFINYWLQGPHVRFRVLPRSPADLDAVRSRVQDALDRFLARRPALFEVTNENLVDYYEKLFDIEYPDADRTPYEDADGRMALRDNNTWSWETYDPEYGRYGGPVAMLLSESHFEVSSDFVAMMDLQLNVHLRTVRLGVSLQLMMVIAIAFLGGEDAVVADFFQAYGDSWRRDFDGTNFVTDKGYDRDYAHVTARAAARFAELRDSIGTDGGERLGGFLREWAAHCLTLRAEIVALAGDGEVTGPGEDGVETTLDPAAALRRLLGSYIHMTNNRLTTTIGDEAYLSHVISGALRQDAAAGLVESA